MRLLFVWLVISVFWGAQPAVAQSALTVVNVALADGFVVTLPDDWPTWVQADYADFAEADAAAVAVFSAVYADVELPTPFTSPEMQLLATPPEASDAGLIRFAVEMLPLSAFAEVIDIDANRLSAPMLAEALGGTLTRTERLNGRDVAFSLTSAGAQQTHSASVIFTEQDRIAVVSLTAPEAFFEDRETLATFTLSSLRLAGEPLAGAAVLAQSGAPLPETWVLPDDIVYVEACDLTAPRSVNLRGGPGTGHAHRARLDPGTEVTVVGSSGDW